MARAREVEIPLPLAGVDQAFAYDAQPNKHGFTTTPDALNVFPFDPATGRRRLGIRPGVISIGSLSAPYNWTPLNYTASSTTTVGIAVVATGGTYTTPDAQTWTEHITTNVGALTYPDQATCAVFRQQLFQAVSGAATVRVRDFVGGSEGALTASAGSVPTKCGIVIRHGNRLWLMGDKDNPHVWYASKINDETDWDYTNITAAGAFVSTGTEGGVVSDPIHAALSHSDNCLLIGSTDSVWMIPGANPRNQGAVMLSRNVGPITPTAWCQDDSRNTYMVTRKGLYRIGAGIGSVPEPLSIGILPNELINLSPTSGDRVSVAYDQRWPGIHIFVNYNSGTDKSFFYDIEAGGLWPQSFSSMPVLAATFPKIMTSNNSSIVMFGGSSVTQFKRAPEGMETGESRTSYVYIPIPLAESGQEGMLQAITASLAEGSGDVGWKIFDGDSAEQAFKQTSAKFTGADWTYSAGPPKRFLNYWQFPRVKAGFAYLRLEGEDNNRWVVEKITGRFISAGRRRVGL